MSSFQLKRNTHKICVHCKSKYPSTHLRCLKCKLWEFGAPTRLIPKKDLYHNIKNIYIINLQRDKQRLIYFYNQLKKQKISTSNRNWHKFNAVDGSQLSIIQNETQNLLDNDESKYKVLKHWEKKPGSIGCYFSHIKLWENIFNDEKSGEYSLIMEDDSFFTPNGLINIEIALTMSRKYQWDMLYTGHNLLKGVTIHPLFVKPYETTPGDHNIGFNSGMFGYVIKKSSIPKLLSIVKQFNSPFIDVQLRNSFGEGPNRFQALFIKSNLIRHSNLNGSSRKNIDIKGFP